MAEKRERAVQTRVAERLAERVKALAPRVAERMRPVLGNVPVSKDERQRRWWQVASDWPTDPEASRVKELELLGYDPDGLPIPDASGNPTKGMSREDVGLLKYPYREIDARAAAGADDERGAAKYAAEMSAMGPPEPEPLEAAAQAAQAASTAGPAASAVPAPHQRATGAPGVPAAPSPAPMRPVEGGY